MTIASSEIAGQLPDYSPILRARHAAHASELEELVRSSPCTPGDSVLDVACGDGAFTRWIARTVGPDGSVVGVDTNAAYLSLARRETSDDDRSAPARYVAGNACALPFADHAFRVAWCAHSFYELPDAAAVLAEMMRVTRPGGAVCVVENDWLHHVLLPWPPKLELAVRAAEQRALSARGDASRFSLARRLPQLMVRAGLRNVEQSSHTINRSGPLDDVEVKYLRSLIRQHTERVMPYLSARRRAALAAWTRRLDASCREPGFALTYVNVLVVGRKPEAHPAHD